MRDLLLAGRRMLVVVGMGACGGVGDSGEPLFREGSGERVVKMVSYDTLWAYGGSGDTLLSAPFRLTAAPSGGVYVLDVATQQIHHLQDGAVQWSWGSIGDGPGEVRTLGGLAVDAETGGPVVADGENQRIVWLSTEGNWVREVSIPGEGVGMVWNMVALSNGEFVLTTSNGNAPLLKVSRDGLQGWPIPPPWQGFRSMHHIQWIGKAFAVDGGRWGFAFESGNGWFVFGADSVRAFPYVEHVDFPEVVEPISKMPTGCRE